MVNFRQGWPREVGLMQQEMERFLDRFAMWKRPLAQFSSGAWQPKVDVYETADELVVLIDSAGVSCEKIDLSLLGQTLTIRGERPDNLRGRRQAFHLMEINFGPFERSIELPAVVDVDRVKTACQDGFLEVVFPKSTQAQSQKVVVKAL
ncbi:MAG: Hsp20/alpha crystallin family protein [Chloroflexi bacterium]|nr:Hsp20/alpha crystallin family protein [Chloroflexota bacterium]